MVLKTLVIGIPIENPEVTKADHANDAPSLFDFDIVIADIDAVLPVWCQNKCPENEYMEAEADFFQQFEKLSERLLKELSFLLKKGGVLVCIMKPKRGISRRYHTTQGYKRQYLSNYEWIPIKDLAYQVAYGAGQEIKTCDTTNAFNRYLQMKETSWTAYFEGVERLGKLGIRSKIIALNHARKPVAIEFYIEEGAIIFVPCSSHSNVGDILLTCAVTSLQKEEEISPPEWLEPIKVPNEDRDLEQLGTIGSEISKLEKEYNILSEKILKETRIKKLLYEKNKSLENIVGETFEELGFSCKKRNDEDWMINSEMGEGILEVTGSEGIVDIQKLRQLLNYLLDDTRKSEHEKKAILVANHFSAMPIEKRGEPFSKKVIDE